MFNFSTPNKANLITYKHSGLNAKPSLKLFWSRYKHIYSFTYTYNIDTLAQKARTKYTAQNWKE